MQPDDIIRFAENQLANASQGTRDCFFATVVHYAEHMTEHQLATGRPIPNAADAVADAAATAQVMLEELRAGWLWQLLATRPKQSKA